MHPPSPIPRAQGHELARELSHTPSHTLHGSSTTARYPGGYGTFRYWMARWTFQPWLCRAAWHSSVVTPCTVSWTCGRCTP